MPSRNPAAASEARAAHAVSAARTAGVAFADSGGCNTASSSDPATASSKSKTTPSVSSDTAAGEPGIPSVGLGAGAHELEDRLVERGLLGRRLDDDSLGEARRQLDAAAREGARVAHHHLPQELFRPLAVAGRERVALLHEPRLESRRDGELARLEEGDEVVELLEIVLDRRGGEQQEKPAPERVEEPVTGRGAVL
jgi:hypothetical protein